MRVDAVTENLMPLVSFVDRVFLSDELSVALADADVVFIAAPETPASRRLIDHDALAAMKDSAYLINVSRGAIVDLDALIETLEKGRLEAVGLDVTDPEPLPANHPIFGFDRVLITPHYAGITTQHTRRFDLIYTNVRRFLAGLPLVNVVDKHLGY
jgi:phosphoglycerate dehydrogenase-like enzyme